VTIWTDSQLEPGETVSALLKRGTNELANGHAQMFVNWSPDHTATSSAFTWYFGGVMEKAFGESEAQSALDQLRTNFVGRQIALTPGQPRELFAVTNNAGETLAGYVEFKRNVPPRTVPGEKIEAIIHIRHFFGSPTSPNISYVAKLPVGYSIRATANSGRADTFSPSGPYGYTSSWSYWPQPLRPARLQTNGAVGSSYSPPRINSVPDYISRMKSVEQQLQDLQDSGPISIVLGQPKLVFSITNDLNNVFQGFLELVGPGTTSRQEIPPSGVEPLVLPPPAIMPPAAVPPPPAGIVRPTRALPNRQTDSALTPEGQMAIIEMERTKAIQAHDPIAQFLPPTRTQVSTNSTNGTNAR